MNQSVVPVEWSLHLEIGVSFRCLPLRDRSDARALLMGGSSDGTSADTSNSPRTRGAKPWQEQGVNGTGGVIVDMSNSTMAELLVHVWSVWEIQTMVLLSFMLQLFLLATGSLRRRNTNGVLRALIWLGYVGADLVAVYALGLFSQYEEKYKLGRESFGDILPFLWVPFLLVHLGGQDSITAFSIEDNNLWLRHLLNLTTQGIVALYIFWKSFHRINSSILIPAMFVFVSGIIKYGERVWALKSASRNGLGKSVKVNPRQNNRRNEVYPSYPSKESYALQTVLLGQGLFLGRTVLQLGDDAQKKLEDDFKEKCGEREEKLKMVVMELGMMFDLLYTKANVLQRWTGVLFRCASQTLMVVAFLLFLLRSQKGAHHNKVNVVISYTLFTGAIFMEASSVVVVMASPWTRALLNESSFLHGLCNYATSIFKAVQCNKRHRSSSSTSMGQFNYMDYCIAMKYKPRLMSKAICAIGLDKQWRNLWYVHHTGPCHHIDNAGRAVLDGIISGVMQILGRPTGEWFELRCVGSRLNYTLCLPFEHALYRLHMFTDSYISGIKEECDDVTMRLKEECQALSNYMMYLMVVHPYMLPVSTAAEDLEPGLLRWVSSNNQHSQQAAEPSADVVQVQCSATSLVKTKVDFLGNYTSSVLGNEPFEPETNGLFQLEQSLKDIKEMWLRLLMYAGGKCRGELHARQLGEGGELITFVWLLMLHHGLGDVATELSLFTSDDPDYQPGSTVSVGNSHFRSRQQGPSYAFNFRRHQLVGTAEWSYGATRRVIREQDGRTRDDDASTPFEIDEQAAVMTTVENQGSGHA